MSPTPNLVQIGPNDSHSFMQIEIEMQQVGRSIIY